MFLPQHPVAGEAPVYERFTDRARKVMQIADQEATRLHHEYLGTEHILLGLVKEGSGVAAHVLQNLGVNLRKIESEVEKLVPPGIVRETMGRHPPSLRAKEAMECSFEETHNLNHNYIGTEHLLLALLRVHDGVAAHVLMNVGVKLEDAREAVLNLLGHNLPLDPTSLNADTLFSLPKQPSAEPNPPRHERFTDRARKVVLWSNEEATKRNHEYIGTEHILLSLLRLQDGLAMTVLMKHAIDLHKVRTEVENLILPGPELGIVGQPPRTPRAKNVIQYAIEEAERMQIRVVGSEHILLGLLREVEGVAAQVLMNQGLKLETVRHEVRKLHEAGGSDGPDSSDTERR